MIYHLIVIVAVATVNPDNIISLVNTLLLIGLAIYGKSHKKEVDAARKDIQNVNEDVKTVAIIAGHAAEAARDTARIAKDIGGQLRTRTTITKPQNEQE